MVRRVRRSSASASSAICAYSCAPGDIGSGLDGDLSAEAPLFRDADLPRPRESLRVRGTGM